MNNYTIEQLIVHRPPMVLIEKLVDYHDKGARCQLTIDQQSPFFKSALDGVPSHIGIEYMAQTIAAYAGTQALEQAEPISIGFLLGSRKYQSFNPVFAVGQQLEVSVEELFNEDSGLCVFDCAIYADGELAAQAKVNAFQPDDPQSFIQEQE
ncbi:MAG: 3-hydroxylacyl-ACP dehydratase [Cognaticolwellia aestuarii]